MNTPTSPSPSSSSTAKRACDACHRRKVKCIGDGARSCKNCTLAGLTCTYNAVPQKKGPKGSRAKVITELRETQRQSQFSGSSTGSENIPDSPDYPRKYGSILSTDIMVACIDFFFLNLYATQPILHRQKVGETIGLMGTNPEAYCLMLSLCAYVLIQPNMELPPTAFDGLEIPPKSSLHFGQLLLKETIRARKTFDHIENPSVWSVITSFFFFGSYFSLNKHNIAWFHLREATTLAHLIGMHEESSYGTDDLVESARRRRLYWLLFVTERAYALQQHKPLTLHPTINLPKLGEDPSETVELTGFLHLVNLFRPFDDTFVGLWNKARTTGATTEWLVQLQQQLSDALPDYLQSTEIQAVDLQCSRQWLHTMVWQLSIGHGFLSSSAAADGAMSFKFPIEVSRDLVAASNNFSQQAMEVHGIGLIEKLFDVACALTDVMACVPQDYNTFEFGPRDYLDQLTKLISSLRGGQQRYLPLLITKMNDALPSANHGYPLSLPLSAHPADDASEGGVSQQQQQQQQHASAPASAGSTSYGDSPVMSFAHPIAQYRGYHHQQEMNYTGRPMQGPVMTIPSTTGRITYSNSPAARSMAPAPSGFIDPSQPTGYNPDG